MFDFRPGLRFDAEWRITLFTVVLVPLMIGLGFWQLQRAAEKSSLAASFEARQQKEPARIEVLRGQPASSLAYAPVQLSGHFLPEAYFLLDNQVRGGQFGYEVLGVLQLDGDGGTVVVNRGWIAGDASRQSLPSAPVVEAPVTVTGHVYVAPGKPFLLAEQQFDAGWPKRIQAVEMDKLAAAIAPLQRGDTFPYMVRIDAGEIGALSVDWQVVNMSPQKHQAYAAQWFAMAAVLFGFYILRSSNVWQLLTGSERAGK
jgi:cytochrome oxidase assembly protein ShyY1